MKRQVPSVTPSGYAGDDVANNGKDDECDVKGSHWDTALGWDPKGVHWDAAYDDSTGNNQRGDSHSHSTDAILDAMLRGGAIVVKLLSDMLSAVQSTIPPDAPQRAYDNDDGC